MLLPIKQLDHMELVLLFSTSKILRRSLFLLIATLEGIPPLSLFIMYRSHLKITYILDSQCAGIILQGLSI